MAVAIRTGTVFILTYKQEKSLVSTTPRENLKPWRASLVHRFTPWKVVLPRFCDVVRVDRKGQPKVQRNSNEYRYGFHLVLPGKSLVSRASTGKQRRRWAVSSGGATHGACFCNVVRVDRKGETEVQRNGNEYRYGFHCFIVNEEKF